MVSVHFLTVFLATSAGMLHSGSDPILPTDWQFHYHQYLCDLATHISIFWSKLVVLLCPCCILAAAFALLVKTKTRQQTFSIS
jgi:hypothetical protein